MKQAPAGSPRSSGGMTKPKPKKLAQLTRAEDMAWVSYFTFHKDNGSTDDEADKRAWAELCREFPRLGDFDGCLP